jgi:DNA helicase II / ATP-dependent DNA helicase PcrA
MKEIQLNPQQREAITHRDGPCLILSVAGSGKSMVLTERIIHLIETGTDPARLLAITFAKKAVLEIQALLKKRLIGYLDLVERDQTTLTACSKIKNRDLDLLDGCKLFSCELQ